MSELNLKEVVVYVGPGVISHVTFVASQEDGVAEQTGSAVTTQVGIGLVAEQPPLKDNIFEVSYEFHPFSEVKKS